MPGTVAPLPHLQFFDNTGKPLSGGSLETYVAGSSTPLATYSDAALGTPNPTTITLNSAGRPSVSSVEVAVFLSPVAYKFILKDSAGVTIWTQDNIYALQAASSVNLEIDGTAGEDLTANDLCFLADGSGSTTQGRWYKFDADLGFYAGINPVLAFATTAIATGASGLFRRGGLMDGFAGLAAGSTYYGSTVAGQITVTAPTNARSVGVAVSSTAIAIDFSPRWSDRISDLHVVDGRLTLTSGTPVTTADVTAATTLYFALYRGNRIALFDGTSQWKLYPLTELSIAVPATTVTMYDVFVYDNSGTLTLELVAWTNDTTRATALTTQNGVLVKSGATSRRYVGSFRTTGSSGQTEDSRTKRFVWNYYNRVPRPVRVVDTTDSWTYTTNTWRQANAAAANKVEVVCGWAEVLIELRTLVFAANTNAGVSMQSGIGENATNAAATFLTYAPAYSAVANDAQAFGSHLAAYPAVGYSYYAWLESSANAGTTTWFGDNGGGTSGQSGLTGIWQG